MDNNNLPTNGPSIDPTKLAAQDMVPLTAPTNPLSAPTSLNHLIDITPGDVTAANIPEPVIPEPKIIDITPNTAPTMAPISPTPTITEPLQPLPSMPSAQPEPVAPIVTPTNPLAEDPNLVQTIS